MQPLLSSKETIDEARLSKLHGRFIRKEKKYTGSSNEALAEVKQAEAHFSKLETLGMLMPRTAHVIAADPACSSINKQPTYIVYGISEFLHDLKPVSDNYQPQLFESTVIRPLLDYYSWAVSTQDNVLSDLVPFCELDFDDVWQQFSYHPESQAYVLHDVDTEIEPLSQWVIQQSIYTTLEHIEASICSMELREQSITVKNNMLTRAVGGLSVQH